MKKLIGGIFCFVLVLAVAPAYGSVDVAGLTNESITGQAWVVTEIFNQDFGNVNIHWQTSPTYDVYIFDADDQELVQIYDDQSGYQTLFFKEDNTDVIAYTTANNRYNGAVDESANLGADGQFYFVIDDGHDQTIDNTPLVDGYVYLLNSSGNKLLVVDAAPVPIPGAGLLLGSGLLGLIGVGLRRQRNWS